MTSARSLLDAEPGPTPEPPPVLVAAGVALSESYAARTWGREATRLDFHVTVPAARAGALDLRDELTGWLTARGLDLALVDDGTSVYLTWPSPRTCPEWGPLPAGCRSVFPPRRPGGRPVYGKPAILELASDGTSIADCADVSIRFALTDDDEAGTLGLYEGIIPQDVLFRTLHDAGLIRRREGDSHA